MNKIKLVLSLLLIGNTVFGQKSEWINFDWHGETIFGKYFDKVAISIPLTIDDLPYKFCGQFDMGATQTLIYGKSFKNYMTPEIYSKLDSLSELYYLNGNKGNFLRNINLKLNNKNYPNTKIAYIYNYGDEIPIDSTKTETQKLIGTIAPDLFQNKYLVIDFPNQKMRTYEKLPRKYQKADFVDIIVRKGRIKIPLEINNKIEYVMFDTGNCLGDLLLDKNSINITSDSNEDPTEFLTGKSWGQDYTIFQKKIMYPIYFNKKNIVLENAQFTYYDDDVKFNKEENIIGLIGPLFFIEKTVIVDYKNNRFGILN